MSNFNLKKFLSTYKPKTIDSFIDKYLQSDKLKGYSFYDGSVELIQQKTYIKYVKICEVGENILFDKIKSGGILLAGGISPQGFFNSTSDYKTWTHLLLKYRRSGSAGKKDLTENIYQINIKKNYIFYCFTENHNDLLKQMFIELLNK